MKKLCNYLIGLLFISLLLSGCQPKADPNLPKDEPCEDSAPLTTKRVDARTVKGGEYPPFEPEYDTLNKETKPYYVPIGPIRGDLKPLNKKFKAEKYDPSGGTSQAVSFEEYDEISDVANAHSVLPEPSVAENGQTVMTTGNFWMSLSLDGGQTFTSVNPTTIFPNDYGGFCCDQVLQYVPEYDMFVWLLQYSASGGQNAIRIAIQNTSAVRSSNGTAWTYWDFTNDALAPSGQLDYNDMSFSRQFLYWTSSIGGGANRYVIRIPLQELNAKGTVNYQFTGSTTAFWSHLTQNGDNAVFWAGHTNNSTMKVYSMRDNENIYSWRDVNINSWPNGTMSSIAANGNDWLFDARAKTYVRAAAMREENKAIFAWNASNSSNFPQAHVQIVEINTSNFNLVNQMQIWNPDFAFAYPYFATNNKGQIGIITAFGGGPFESSSGVGVWGDFVIYYPRLSQRSNMNYGHYHTTRRSGSNGEEWVSAGYTYEPGNGIQPYYVRFKH